MDMVAYILPTYTLITLLILLTVLTLHAGPISMF